MTTRVTICLLFLWCQAALLSAQPITAGAGEKTPSLSMYFDWINRNWHGSTEKKALAGIGFFEWMKDEYGMQLDIFLLDAGVFDNGPNCSSVPGRPAYGNLSSPWFKQAYPNGLQKIYERASQMGTRLGLWIGPDGYGNTRAEAAARINLLAGLCRDYKLRLFKMDACCSDLRPEKEPFFITAMQQARKYSPDLIVLNHRISLSDKAKKYATTFLWEGRETYIDVNNFNDTVAPHHRQGNMKRGLPPGLQRLTEDHGICFSSALDYWEDDLVLQAFNRSLVIAPEIYGNPWLLRDEEFARLARIFNLHRRYNGILVNAKELPGDRYGYKAVSRGDTITRLLTLCNLSWHTQWYGVAPDSSIGLGHAASYHFQQYHPVEKYLGQIKAGSTLAVEVPPFRSVLVNVTARQDNFFVEGTAYQVTREMKGKPLEVTLLGMPGTRAKVKVHAAENSRLSSAMLDGQPAAGLLADGMEVSFAGDTLKLPWHRKIGVLPLTNDTTGATPVYETMCFSNDNDALETRSLTRAGKTRFTPVQAARDAFFKDSLFRATGSWQQFAFDADTSSYFKTYATQYSNGLIPAGALRVAWPAGQQPDSITLEGLPGKYDAGKVSLSPDLVSWHNAQVTAGDGKLLVLPQEDDKYLKLEKAPAFIGEIKGYRKTRLLPSAGWHASNLFANMVADTVKLAWRLPFMLTEAAPGAYLALTVPGYYNTEQVWAGLKIGDSLIAPSDRSPSFPYNNWEHVDKGTGNVTFYFAVSDSILNQNAEMLLFSANGSLAQCLPELWITAYPSPYAKRQLVLE
ncbi:hypothetical protein [Foetidibacter luteolus]|uniref:hypothetical protein n=1 Tax=Foetidibacter luteolus TaxID=2608880 RepID=UPI00129BDB59|nr:hypothetical protein [Foetidibacter luteolus]